jgi:hypothetical protein
MTGPVNVKHHGRSALDGAVVLTRKQRLKVTSTHTVAGEESPENGGQYVAAVDARLARHTT